MAQKDTIYGVTLKLKNLLNSRIFVEINQLNRTAWKELQIRNNNILLWKKILEPSGEPRITVSNDVDLEPPPANFKYINTPIYADDVPKPADSIEYLVGCNCHGKCDINKPYTCGCSSRDPDIVQNIFPYNSYGQVVYERGYVLHECNTNCSCGPDCPNRVVQRGKRPKMEIFRTKSKGWGVRAMEPIEKSTFVVEYAGKVVRSNSLGNTDNKNVLKNAYLFDLDLMNKGHAVYTVDAYEYGNVAHFFNHSCEPNLEVFCIQIDFMDPRLHRLAFFSKRFIKKGEELTFDYLGQDSYIDKIKLLKEKEKTENKKKFNTGNSGNKNNKKSKKISCKTRHYSIENILSSENDMLDIPLSKDKLDEDNKINNLSFYKDYLKAENEDKDEEEIDIENRLVCHCGSEYCRGTIY